MKLKEKFNKKDGQNKKEKKPLKQRIKESMNGKYLKNGSYSVVISAIFIVIVIVINMIVGYLPSKYTEFDVSSQKLYSIGDETKAYLKKLDKDIAIYQVVQSGSEDETLKRLLEKYAEESSHIKVETKDPVVNPKFTSQYTSDDVSANSLIVVCGDRSKVVSYDTIYQSSMDYNTYSYTTTGFDGEGQIDSAISYVTSENLPILYTLDGHGEKELDSTLKEDIEKANIDIQSLNLLTEESVPDDAACLLINAPTSDISETEKDAIIEYLENGGKVLLTTSGYTETPDLDAVMAQFGLAREPGLVVEGDAGHALYGYPYSLFPDYAAADESTALDGVNQSTHVMLSVAQGITITETDDVTAEPLLYTTEDAYSKQDFDASSSSAKEAGDTDGPFSLAVWARNDSTGAEVIWIGCPNMDNEQVYQSIPGNLTFLQGCAASLVGQSLLIDTKALEAAPITVPASASMTLGMVFVFVLPAAVLIAGAVEVLLRRRR